MNEEQFLIPIEFVGGPLDGAGEVHPLMNMIYLKVEGHPEGYYSVNPYNPFDGKMYWLLEKK